MKHSNKEQFSTKRVRIPDFMKKRSVLTRLCAALGLLIVASGPAPISKISMVSEASAADPSDPRGDRRRFDQCRALKNSGGVNWYGISSGTVNNAGGRANRGGYHVKACFAREAECNRWVARIWHEIPHLDEIHAVYCTQRRF